MWRLPLRLSRSRKRYPVDAVFHAAVTSNRIYLVSETPLMNDSNESATAPEVLEDRWEMQKVDSLFDDLRQGAEVQHVQVRRNADGVSEDQVATLDEAQRLLHCGQAKAIQIRYRFENQSWCDTLMIESEDVRIIRTRL